MSKFRVKMDGNDKLILQKSVGLIFWKGVAFTFLSTHDYDAEVAVKWVEDRYTRQVLTELDIKKAVLKVGLALNNKESHNGD